MIYSDAAHEAYRRLIAEQRYTAPEPPEETEKRRVRDRVSAMIRRRLPRVV
jgi:hypothetical protein